MLPDAPTTDLIQSLVIRPQETLSVEVKGWIDPNAPEGRAKIAKSCLALRNQNGGFLVIGFDDSSLAPITIGRPQDITSSFHPDIIQGIVSAYSSHPFEVFVHFPQREGLPFPVIQVPSGVITMVACKADLDVGGKAALRVNDIYVRTLNSNGTVSSAKASWKDLDSLMNRCHENREADLARLFGRMAQGMTRESFMRVLNTFSMVAEASAAITVDAKKFLERGAERFDAVVRERQLQLPPHGCWDTALVIQGEIPNHRLNRTFLQLLASANPSLTGWPVWLDSTNFSDETARPYVADNRWEAMIYRDRGEEFGAWGHLDFWMLDPQGRFFLRRAHQDDLGGSKDETVMTVLDPYLAIIRVAEALAVGQSFGRAMGCSDAGTNLSFAFRWTKLRGRRLEAWASPWQPTLGHGISQQDDASSTVVLPLSANEESICLAVHEAILPVMACFGGYDPSYELTRSWAIRVLQRKL